MKKGIGASRGVAIAKAFCLKPLELDVTLKKVNDASNEIKIYKNSLEKSINQINVIKSKAVSLSDDERMVFDAHVQLAQDPAIIEEIENMITTEKCNAAYAINNVANKYIDMFKSIGDPYMAERASDIKDVYNRIIANVNGLDIPDLTLIEEEVIIVATDLTPSETGQLNKKFIKGFATDIGGRTSHSAIMARSLEIPAVLGLKTITSEVKDGDIIAINGDSSSGEVIINPTPKQIEEFKKQAKELEKQKAIWDTFKNKPSQTKDGKKITIAANIGSPKDVASVVSATADCVGLFRSEFLYMDKQNWPTEDEQFEAYKEVLSGMNGKQVIIRTLDIGGDKTLDYFKFPEESNPFLGYRAIRLCLDKQDIFRTQLRALIRASEFGNLAIMFPMIATLDEFKAARKLFDEEFANIKKTNKNISDKIQVGMMVEVPSTAVHAEIFCKYADFVSIGTNDLMQYTMASDRMNEKVSYLYKPLNPSILKLIKMTIDGAHKCGKWCGMCGEMAGDIKAIPMLIAMGIDELSMSASSVLRARELCSRIDSKEAAKVLEKVLECDDQDQVIDVIQNSHLY